MLCPNCHQDVAPTPVGFTWWGGLVGARLLGHVECPGCHGRFNGKTGRPNTAGIAVYVVVVGCLFAGLLYYLFTTM